MLCFKDLLCDLEVWHEAPGELLRSHLEHLYELASESSEKRNNVWVMRDLQLVMKLLQITADVKHAPTRQVCLLEPISVTCLAERQQIRKLW